MSQGYNRPSLLFFFNKLSEELRENKGFFLALTLNNKTVFRMAISEG